MIRAALIATLALSACAKPIPEAMECHRQDWSETRIARPLPDGGFSYSDERGFVHQIPAYDTWAWECRKL